MSTERQSIQAVYADPQVDGMEDLYQAIASKMSLQQNFAQAYAEVIASGDKAAKTWIRFCVKSSSRFQTQPKEEDFLAVLEQHCRQSME